MLLVFAAPARPQGFVRGRLRLGEPLLRTLYHIFISWDERNSLHLFLLKYIATRASKMKRDLKIKENGRKVITAIITGGTIKKAKVVIRN